MLEFNDRSIGTVAAARYIVDVRKRGFTILYYIVLYSVFYCTVLYYIVLYCLDNSVLVQYYIPVYDSHDRSVEVVQEA